MVREALALFLAQEVYYEQIRLLVTNLNTNPLLSGMSGLEMQIGSCRAFQFTKGLRFQSADGIIIPDCTFYIGSDIRTRITYGERIGLTPRVLFSQDECDKEVASRLRSILIFKYNKN